MNGLTTEPARLAEGDGAGGPLPWLAVPGWRERFGVVAGITTRGPTPEPFDLGLAGSQGVGRVLDRWRVLGAAFPEFVGVAVARQVHGTRVLWQEPFRGFAIHEDADGHATSHRGLLLSVSAADCVPVYLVDPVGRAIALLHAGWRGTAAGIVAAGVEALVCRAGSAPADLVMHCGVGICGDCYQVGPEVASACGRPDQPRVDLRAVLAEQGRAQGIGTITVSSHCSAHMTDRFMSHRGSGGRDGRMVAFLGLLAP